MGSAGACHLVINKAIRVLPVPLRLTERGDGTALCLAADKFNAFYSVVD